MNPWPAPVTAAILIPHLVTSNSTSGILVFLGYSQLLANTLNSFCSYLTLYGEQNELRVSSDSFSGRHSRGCWVRISNFYLEAHLRLEWPDRRLDSIR
jgi:hypothetical protein